ncbi:carbohydrate sulfotransferase 11 isoform X1 [Drosophila innubila]|uniref:carbohydrate sulfotransferase 11 isoform X1 n=1 Tax=Drosophila innubila TaxID=198719 RepID=UPI00148BD034|nr:carbohydrate sulfotransferase 11 isoform X1 [Drosophila innubila]XP_034482973.1 carbohydrate sulfotransferase 11 isoform X1 [Drosophila innubila]XP_034482974.1 carbohydrate sulfotransferase 11 isoform X1 [Drosophila innubila]XP_034482975.1 carbohydrate sulfotransferase 11 isoform X1 [Drosophila innubila]
MKLNKSNANCRVRRYLLIFTALSLLLLPLSLIYLVWNEQLQKIKGYEAFNAQQQQQQQQTQQTQQQQQQLQQPLAGGQTFRYPVLLLNKNKNKELTVVATGKTKNKWRYVDKINSETGLPLIPDYAVQTLSQEEMQEMSVRMEARLERLKDKCSEYGLDVLGHDSWHTPNTWEFLVNKKYHIIWCNVFKAASSSWMFNFNVLAGYTPSYLHKTKKILLNLARERYPRVTLQELREAQNDSITFIIARNPFERLLSAYRDKIVFALPYSFHDKLGRSIVRTYRKKPKLIARAGNTKYPSFPEFVHWLLDQVKRGNYIDMHFVSATSFCTPCLIRFDMILKFESLAEDQLYLIEKTGLKRVIAPVWRNMGKGGRKTEELQQQFYSQLTRQEMMALYEYYQFDFDLFGYDVKEYLNYARADSLEDAAASVA